jgi:predicted TIM-barrel fold metal-dependent hydrolase
MATIIDADGHIVEPRSVWQEYTEPAYRDRVIQIVRDRDGIDRMMIDGEVRVDRNMAIAAACTPGGLSDPHRARTMSWDEIVPGGYDPHVRVKDMDLEGIEVAFFYPTLWLLYGDLNDPKLAAAACRAYNNWMADFCKPYPERFFGVAPLPLQDVDEAVKEMRRVVKDLGMRAVFIRPNPYNGRRLNDPAYDPFWREAQELNIPVAIHGSFGTKMPTLGQERYKDPFFFHMVCHPWEQQGACMDVVCGGVLSKFPKLKVAFLESGVGWIGHWLDRMDGHFEKMGHYVPWLKRRPSELFREQCFISMDPDEHTLKVVVEMGLEDCIVWGSDYPHFDCTFPGVVDEVKEACAPLAPRAQQKIIGENTRRLYNL